MRGELRRVVCLTAESVDLLDRLGAADLIVGVSAYASAGAAVQGKVVVSGYTTIHYDRIDRLAPDLVIGFSDLQADAAAELGKRGHTVLLTNQRSLADVLRTCRLVGRAVGREQAAERLVGEMEQRWEQATAAARSRGRRPRVYFEEWDEPLITGIAWVGELLEAAGGVDVFADRRAGRSAAERVVSSVEVIQRAPEIILASWCGKPFRRDVLESRPGWSQIPAVRDGRVHELEGHLCLQPGPTLFFEGLAAMERLLA